MTPYPALTNHSVLARWARALSSAAIISALAEVGRISRHRKRTTSAVSVPDTRSVTGLIPRVKRSLLSSRFLSKLKYQPPSVDRYTPSVISRSDFTELRPEITSRWMSGPGTAHEMNSSYSPSSGAVTFHLIVLEFLQFTEIFRLSSL